jgi:hypothetical protein
MRLARRLTPRPARRRLLERALAEGMLPLFIAGLGALCGLDYAAAWEVLADPRGRGPAIAAPRRRRRARRGAPPSCSLANRAGPLVSGAEGDATAAQLELYDSLDQRRRARCCGLAGASRLSRQRRPRLDPRPPSAEAA